MSHYAFLSRLPTIRSIKGGFFMLTNVWIRNVKLAVDLYEELQPYFDGHKVRWTEDKLSAPSPFRNDRSPSFFVNLINLPDKEIAGSWIDSGSSEGDYYRSGRLEKLLAYLRNESEEETNLYLMEKYGVKDYDKLTLNLDYRVKKEWKPLLFQGEEFAFDYLGGRGISQEVIRNAGVMDLGDKIAFHWYSPQGVVEAIKYRFKANKCFYYEKGGKRLNEKLYNLQRVYERSFDYLWICEGETDALSVETMDANAVGVAIGGASFSDKQKDLVLRSGIKNVVIATDNDKQGNQVAEVIKGKLGGFVNLYRVSLNECKDVNEFIINHVILPNFTSILRTQVWRMA